MAVPPRKKLQREKRKLESMAEAGELKPIERDALLEWADAIDPKTVSNKYIVDGTEKTMAPRSIIEYLASMRLSVERGLDLLNSTAEDVNDRMDYIHDNYDVSKSTMTRYQCAARSFYGYHSDIGIEPDNIHIYKKQNRSRHDEQDMFTNAEVESLRNACERPRDRAFLELLIFTGQRITALRTLRIKDVDVNEGVIYLNDDYDREHGGMKGALKRGRKRPMFGARKYVRDWVEYHPNKSDPDAPLFVGMPNSHMTKLNEPWNEAGVYAQLKRIAERAGVEKPVNPHNFRHYFVTCMKRDYAMDADTLRALLGVAKDSVVLDTTYAHVTNDDYIRKAEEQLGYREESTGSPLTPDLCPTCGELLQDHWKACPACGEVFAPEVKQIEAETSTAIDKGLSSAFEGDRPLTSSEREALRGLIDLMERPGDIADRID